MIEYDKYDDDTKFINKKYNFKKNNLFDNHNRNHINIDTLERKNDINIRLKLKLLNKQLAETPAQESQPLRKPRHKRKSRPRHKKRAPAIPPSPCVSKNMMI